LATNGRAANARPNYLPSWLVIRPAAADR